ncbi:myotrophin homolog [Diadema setosum]|uniref:myotrophin homolog n=1 Tax=Diadema setosum TaxID=31175 RepID=UPI003B3A2487
MATEAKWAVQNGDLDKLTQIADSSSFDVNGDVGMGRTLLHCAADYGQIDCIKYLVDQHNANVNAVDKHGVSVLLAAVFEGSGHERYYQCIEYLIEKGADTKGKAPDGSSYADSTDDPKIKELLQ